MKLKIIALYALFTLMGCSAMKQKKGNSSSEYFKVEITQNEKVVYPKDGVISLEKKPFKFKVTLYKVTGVDVSASWGKYYYDYPADQNIYECKDDRSFEGCRFVAVKTGNEDAFNENKDIYVGDGDYQFHWFYHQDKDWHRFDKGVKFENGVTYAEVTVENIYDMDKRDSRDFTEAEYKYPLEKMKEDIYMVFAASHYESGMPMPEELQRDKFILRFK